MWRECNKTAAAALILLGTAIDADAELANLLAQCVPVQSKQFRRLDLVAPGCRHRGQHERVFHFGQDALVEPGRRQIATKRREIALQVTLDRLGDGYFLGQERIPARTGMIARLEFGLDDLLRHLILW